MNRIKHGVVVVLLVSASACMDISNNESESLNEQELSSGDSPQLVQNWNITAGNAQSGKGSGDISPSVDCVFIEWCNRPASISPDIGTVCRVRTGCAFPPTTAIVNECTNDAIAVCGGITQPAWICRQGFTCPPG